MREDVTDRVIEEAEYIAETGATVRKTAKIFNFSKSTVHKDVTERLRKIDKDLAEKVKKVLEDFAEENVKRKAKMQHIDINEFKDFIQVGKLKTVSFNVIRIMFKYRFAHLSEHIGSFFCDTDKCILLHGKLLQTYRTVLVIPVLC